MKKIFFILLAICAAGILIMSNTANARPGFPPPPGPPVILTVDANTNYVVEETTRVSVLIIGENATMSALTGYSLTMTVNGVETPIEEGIYKGNIMLTLTEQVEVTGSGGPPSGSTDKNYYRTAIYIEDGAVAKNKSVLAAAVGGKITDSSVKDVKITSVGPKFNGIFATSSSSSTTPFSYTIERPVINFTGNGGNDFAGYGAAIASTGYANVVVNKAKIETNGVIRGAVFTGGNSTMTVNNSYIHTGSPELPEVISGMMSVPWPLGLTGTCRSTIVVGNGTAYYNNSHIVAEGWGALSTDACQDVKLYATNCLIETIESGYGSYADGTSIDIFSGCRFNVSDMALILTQGDAVFTDGTVVNSGRFGVMQHSGRGTGNETLTINKGCVFNTEEAVMMIKSSAPNIIVDNAKLNSKNGVILQAMVSDDAGSGKNGGTISASFSNMNMKGDIVNAMTSLGALNVTFSNATITGAITTSVWTTQASKIGVDLSIYGPFDTNGYVYSYLIGQGENTYCDPNETYGLTVSLDADSRWIVEETSYLTGLTVAEGAVIQASKCGTVTMTVNGTVTPIAAGAYTGKIVLSVTEGNCQPPHHGHHHPLP